jgi:hypothetical protein
LGNWQASPVFIYETPQYFTVASGIDSNLNSDSAGDRTVLNPKGAAGVGTGVYGLDKNGNRINIAGSTTTALNNVVAWVAINPNARYIQAGYGAWANTGRNTEPTRPISNVDFSLMKKIQIREKSRFEISGQAYNLFNHAQFVPGSVSDVRRVNTSGSTAYVNATNVNFNNPEKAFSSNPRLMQIVARFVW